MSREDVLREFLGARCEDWRDYVPGMRDPVEVWIELVIEEYLKTKDNG